tara:strand:- start:5142 stop:5420 length:279 start_codon:yes stop_codon:yes gene_type:complete
MNLEKDSKKTKKLRPLSIYEEYYEPKDKAISIHRSKKPMAFKPSKKNRFIQKKFEDSRVQTVNDPIFNHVGFNYGGKKTRKTKKSKRTKKRL